MLGRGAGLPVNAAPGAPGGSESGESSGGLCNPAPLNQATGAVEVKVGDEVAARSGWGERVSLKLCSM